MRNTRRRSGQSGTLDDGQPTLEPNGVPSDPQPAPVAEENKKPSKKRKLHDSPPWKSATTQTPTTFMSVDGRRRSGRTNILPSDLMGPPPPVVESPSRLTRAARQPSVPEPAASSRTRAPASGSKSRGKPKVPQSPNRSSSRFAKPVTPTSASARPNAATRTPPSKKGTSGTSAKPRVGSKSTPSRSASSRSWRSPTKGTRKSARALQKAVAAAEEELAAQGLAQSSSDDDSSELSSLDSYYDMDEDEIEDSQNDPTIAMNMPKLKLRFGMPKPVITHPSQVIPPPQFASLEDFLAQDDPARTEEDEARLLEQAQEEAKVRNKIEHEAKYGLLTRENCTLFLPPKQPEPPQLYAHHDHLLAHALHLRRLMGKERREHVELMRKRNAAIIAEINRRRPKTKEEIEREEFIKNEKLYKEQIAQLRRKWEEVTKAVDQRRIQRAEEERRQQGKQHLNQMLEHSTLLLDARRGDRQDTASEDEVEEGEEDGEEEVDGSESEESESSERADANSDEDPNDANMSTSESELEVDGADEDLNLTVEELKVKYAGIASAGNGNDDEEMPDFTPDSELLSDVDMADERSQDVALDLEQEDGTLSDTSDESIDMDSGSSDPSDNDEDEDGGSDGDEDEDENDDGGDDGLLGFYVPADFTATLTEEPEQYSEAEDPMDYGEDSGEDSDDSDTVDLVGVPKPPPRQKARSQSSLEHTPVISTDAAEMRDSAKETERLVVEPEPVKMDISEPENSVSEIGHEELPDDVDLNLDVQEEEPAHSVATQAQSDGVDTLAKAHQETAYTRDEVNGRDEHSETSPEDVSMTSGEQPRVVETEEPTDSKPTERLINGKLECADAETATSVSQLDPKDSGAQSSPTTSPEATPVPQLNTSVPFLLRGTLREYQHYGLDWLAALYDNHTNGILADEMGLGKTIQTIALIAHLACEKGVWGPHLIVVPTSVMLNWEMEFKKWAPGFKILTYYGSREQRAEKRKGWYDTNLWHICITSYQLVLQDQVTFKRRNWHYLILDEAHNIKNFRSQRWQTLLNFKSEARLLLTGTPLQNNLVELWSLLYFLMPSGSTSLPAGFANLQEFQEWFAHPVDQLMEGGRDGMDDEARRTVTKLHKVLRPYLLRRLKADVEKQMPAKYEHIVYCRLSKRQRYLYDDFMSMAKTRETLASGNYLSIINCLMQLRKVCNHPDLFETRQIVTSFAMQRSAVADYETKELLVRRRLLNEDPFDPAGTTDFLDFVGLVPANHNRLSKYHTGAITTLSATQLLQKLHQERAAALEPAEPDFITVQGNTRYAKYQSEVSNLEKLKTCVRLNRARTSYQPLCSSDLVEVCSRGITAHPTPPPPRDRKLLTEWCLNHSEIINGMIPTLPERAESMQTAVIKFGCVTPVVVAADMPQIALAPCGMETVRECVSRFPVDPFHEGRIRLSIAFPDKRLLQYDCGKLQRLDALLRELQAGGHRALIFTQMTKVLDILEQFLNIHGHRYLRLDGATKVEQRQQLTDRFNNDARIPVFILSTRSGGLGINLTGADTVIFYDLDWNPAMDKQCQDRCHRIGQTRDVHIYRFVSEYTIESNILRKSEQKRMLDNIVIQEGEFTTDYFHKLSIRDMLGDELVNELRVEDAPILQSGSLEKTLEAVEDIEDAAAAKVAQKEVVDTDVADFDERGTPQNQTPREPGTVTATSTATTTASKDPSVSRDVSAAVTAAPTPRHENLMDLDVNKGIGHDIYGEGWGRVDREPDHIDDYMIRYIEWELTDVPVVLPNKDKKKRSKKGKRF